METQSVKASVGGRWNIESNSILGDGSSGHPNPIPLMEDADNLLI
jgi:hypothetical protein